MVLKKTITADGIIVVEDDGRWFQIPKYVDTFGIHWEFRHFVVLCALITVVTFEDLGFWGLGVFLTVLSIYTLHQRRKAAEAIRWGAKKTIIVSTAAEDGYGANGTNNGDLPHIV